MISVFRYVFSPPTHCPMPDYYPCTHSWAPFMQVMIVTGGIPDPGDSPLRAWPRTLHRQRDYESIYLYLLLTWKGKEEGWKRKKKGKKQKTFSGRHIIATFNMTPPNSHDTPKSDLQTELQMSRSVLSTLAQTVRPPCWWGQS